MKIILLVILLISGMYSFIGLLDIGVDQNKKYKEIKKKKTFEEKILIPKGMEKEYALVYKGKNPFIKKEKEEILKKEAKQNLKKEKKEIKSNKQNAKKTYKIDKKQHIFLKTKIKNIGIVNDNLIVDLLIFNNSDKIRNGFVNVTCKSYFKGQENDIYQWKGSIKIKPKKAILLKEMDFGYSSFNKIDDYWCFVNSFKEH